MNEAERKARERERSWVRMREAERRRARREVLARRHASRGARLVQQEIARARMAAKGGDVENPQAAIDRVGALPQEVREQVHDAIHGRTSSGRKVSRLSNNLSVWQIELQPSHPTWGSRLWVQWSAKRQAIAAVYRSSEECPCP